MAFTQILIISVVTAVAQAGYAGQGFERKQFQMPNMFYPTPPQAPFLPGFGRLMLPTPPFNFGHNIMMPTPPFHPSMIHVAPVQQFDIANFQPGPGREYSGVMVSSKSGYKLDKDGKWVPTHGSTVITNNNGDVQQVKVGDNPPDPINNPIVIPPFHDFGVHEMPKFKHIDPDFDHFKMPKFKHIDPHFDNFKMPGFDDMKMPVFEDIKMPEFEDTTIFEPKILDKENIRTHVPGKNEHYVAVSHSKHFTTSNNNGVVTSSGGAETILNKDGNVQAEKSEFTDDDKKEKEKKRKAEKNKKHNEKKRNDDDKAKIFERRVFDHNDKENIKTYVPGKNEHYLAVSQSSHFSSSNNNGVVTSSGGAETILNKDGNVQAEKSEFRDDDKKEKEKKRKAEKNKKQNEKKRGDDDDEAKVENVD